MEVQELSCIARCIDHTLLRPDATAADIRNLCAEARQYGFASVCVNPYWVPLAAAELAGSPVKVCTVVGFPLGASATEIKVAETEDAVRAGAQEIDMVLNIGELRGGNYDAVRGDIQAVVTAAHRGGAIVKVILETGLLDDDQKIIACTLAQARGRGIRQDLHRVSAPHGATVHDVALMRRTVGAEMGVKASGGIRTLEDLKKMLAAGATRIGASASVKIIEAASAVTQPSMTQPRKAPVRFRERVELLDFLLEVSRITAETLDLDKLLENVAAIVKDVVPYDLFAILLWSDRQQGLSIRYAIGHREEVVRTLTIRLNEGITGAAAATRAPILVDDVRQDPRYLNALDAVRSELAVPMMARGKLVGVIDLQSTRLQRLHRSRTAA